MASLVYVKEINPKTWLHWSYRGESSCLRDFRSDPPLENREYSTEQIQSMLAKKGNYYELAPEKPVSNRAFWKGHIGDRNHELGLSGKKPESRLLKRFQADTQKYLEQQDFKGLRAVFRRYIDKFEMINDKVQFNHWDNDDASEKASITTGLGWTATMLERCRASQGPSFITTAASQSSNGLDFAFLAMELNLGISSKKNQFVPGEKDYIKPDGLGIRRDSSFCVLEVKGPQDDSDLIKATLQATCGALAIFSKREMITQISREQGNRRPALKLRGIPKGRPSLGAYILMSTKKKNGTKMFNWDKRLDDYCQSILVAFPQLREFVFIPVDASQSSEFKSLRAFKVIERP